MEAQDTSGRIKRWLATVAAGAAILLCSFSCGWLASKIDVPVQAWLAGRPTSPAAVPIDVQTPTLAATGRLYDALVARLENDTVQAVRFAGRDLIVLTNLDRASDSVAFYGEIGSIHGAIFKLDPDADRLVVQDRFGWQLIVPMEDLRQFSEEVIDYYDFRDSWIEIDPD
jgi:hypothetical protein